MFPYILFCFELIAGQNEMMIVGRCHVFVIRDLNIFAPLDFSFNFSQYVNLMPWSEILEYAFMLN